MAEDTAASADLLVLTTGIVASHVANNPLPVGELPGLIQSVHSALAGLGDAEPVSATPEHVPAVSVRKSLASSSHLLSLIDGKPYTALKRHLAKHGLTPAQYRERYGLKPDYPMVSPAYTETRRAIAKAVGLGRRISAKIVDAATAVEEKVEEVVAPKPTQRRRTPQAEQASTSDSKPAKATKPAKAAKPRRK